MAGSGEGKICFLITSCLQIDAHEFITSLEIDLIIEQAEGIDIVEIKSGATVSSDSPGPALVQTQRS